MSLKRIAFSLALVLAACGAAQAHPKPHVARAEGPHRQAQLARFETPGLVVGELGLAEEAVIDGDTVRVAGIGTTLRLLGVDAEETFKHEKERRAYEAGWESYLKEARGDSPRPVKFATPLGDEAKHFAQKFFSGVTTVRLERDHSKEIRDYYNRYLAYIIAVKDGRELNYNVELVRAGYSPYFTKYGYSRRFHREFVEAEREARDGHRGIWDASKRHYVDYSERKVWWDARAEFIRKFEEAAAGKANYLMLTNWDTTQRLEALMGQEVVMLGAISSVRLGDRGPTRVMLSRRRGADFPLIFFDKDIFLSTGLAQREGEYVTVRGTVSRYQDPRGKTTLQIVIDSPGQILAASGG